MWPRSLLVLMLALAGVVGQQSISLDGPASATPQTHPTTGPRQPLAGTHTERAPTQAQAPTRGRRASAGLSVPMQPNVEEADEREPTARLFSRSNPPTQDERDDFDPTGRLTEDGRARRCPVALADLSAREAALPERDRCGWAHAALTPLMDAAFERGCLTDAEWGAFYERVGQHRAQMGVSLDALVGLNPDEACGQDAWGQAELTEAHACAALMRQDGYALLGPETQIACRGSDVLQGLPFDLGLPPG